MVDVVDYDADLALIGRAAHFPAELTEGSLLRRTFDVSRQGITVDDHRFIPYEAAAAFVVAPNATRPRKRRRPAEQRTQQLQRSASPAFLIHRVLVAIDARQEEHD